MNNHSNNRTFQWLPMLIIIWNIIDIAVHVAVDMVEPLRVSGNIVGIAAVIIVWMGLANKFAPHILGGAAVLTIILNTFHASEHGAAVPMLVFIGVSVFLLLWWAKDKLGQTNDAGANAVGRFFEKPWAPIGATGIGVAIVLISGFLWGIDIKSQVLDGTLVAADYWGDEPKILSAGMGFDNIIGISETTEEVVREAGGNWYGSMSCTNGEIPEDSDRTSTVPADSISSIAEGFADYDDGLPIVFSWPLATETIDVTDFQFTLNTGDVVFPHSMTMTPNWEYNERNVVVAFGDFGSRGLSREPDVIFPIKLEIVADETPLLLIGP